MSLPCTISEIQHDIGQKMPILTHPTCIWHLRWGGGGGDPFEFCQELCHQKARVPGLFYGIICVILRLAVLVQYW